MDSTIHEVRTPLTHPTPSGKPIARQTATPPPREDEGEFAKRFREVLERRNPKLDSAHQDKHSDYWMG